MLRQFIALWAILGLISAPLSGVQVTRYEDLVVGKITVVVEDAKSQEMTYQRSVKGKIQTREGRTFSQQVFDEDLKQLASEFEDVHPEVNVENGSLDITLWLTPKPKIQKITINGNSAFKKDTLYKELGVPTGTLFDRAKFNQSVQKVYNYYVKKGYFEADVTYEIEPGRSPTDVIVNLKVLEGRCGQIKEIRFKNFSEDEQNTILGQMITKKWHFVWSLFYDQGIYHQEVVERDEMIIVDFLRNEGYADAEVEITTHETSPGSIVLKITATKGTLYEVGAVTFEGNKLFNDDTVRKHLKIADGRPYSPKTIRETITALRDLYGSKGYIDAFIEEEVNPVEGTNAYNVHFIIEEGNQYRVGLIKVLGNTCTDTSVILHECILIPGEVFNSEKLELTEMRLKNIDYFESVNVYTVPTDESWCLGSQYRDIHIEVIEKKTGAFNLFIGASNTEHIFGGIGITEKNFNHGGLYTLATHGFAGLRGGGEYLNLTAQFGAKSQKYGLSWSEPYFRNTNWIVGFDIEHSDTSYVSNHYDISALSLTLRARYPINQYVHFGTHYRIRSSNVHIHTRYKVDEDGNTVRDTSGNPIVIPPPPKLSEEAKNSGAVSAAGVSFTYDCTNRIKYPTSGYRSIVDVEFAGIGGHHRYFGLGYRNSWFISCGNEGVLRVRADGRTIMPVGNSNYETLPLDERLIMGGPNNVRGYEDFSIGPRFKTLAGENTDDPRGGLSMALFSLEYTYRYWCSMEPFAFYDMGMLSASSWSIDNVKTSVGFGLNVNIIPGIPPVSVGLGFPINRDRGDDVQHFFFSAAGSF